MNRLLSLKIRKATKVDEEIFEKGSSPESSDKFSGYLYDPEIPMSDLKEVLDTEKKLVEGTKVDEEVEEEGEVDVPSEAELQEGAKEVKEVEISTLDDTSITRLLKRLPQFEPPSVTVDEDGIFRRSKSAKPIPDSKNVVEIEFPPKEQRKLAKQKSGATGAAPELMVTSYSPTGGLQTCQGVIRITFNQKMYQEDLKMQHSQESQDVDLIAHKRSIRRIVQTRPDFPKLGEWRWETPNTCVFTTRNDLGSDGLFVGSTEYGVVIPRGTKSVKGGVLEKTLSFKFSTPRLKVMNFLPNASYARVNTVAPILGVQFNFDVNPVEVMKKLTFKKVKKILNKKIDVKLYQVEEMIKKVNEDPFFTTQRGSYVDPMHVFVDSCEIYQVEKTRVNWQGKEEKYMFNMLKDIKKNNCVFFTLTGDRLDQDAEYVMKIDKDLPSLKGNLKSDAVFTKDITTMQRLKISYSSIPSSEYEYQPIEWKIEFNNPLSTDVYEKKKREWITLENIVSPQVWIDGSAMFLKGRIQRDVKRAKVVIGKSVEDVFGNIHNKTQEYSINVHLRDFKVSTELKQKLAYSDRSEWRIYFNMNLNRDFVEKNIDRLVTVTPKLHKQEIKVESTSILIIGSPIGALKFQVKISQDLQSSYETKLKKEFVLNYKLKKVDKFLQCDIGNTMKVHDPTLNEAVIFSFFVRNIPKARILVYKVDPVDYYTCPLGPNKMSINEWNRKDTPIDIFFMVNLDKNKIVFDEYIETKGVTNEKKRVDFDLSKFLHPTKNVGNLFVVVEFPDKKELRRSIYQWIQVTNVSLDAFFQNRQNVVMLANSLIDGTPIKQPNFFINYVKSTSYKSKSYRNKEDHKCTIWSCYYPTFSNVTVVGDEMGLAEKLLKSQVSSSYMLSLEKDGDSCFLPSINRSYECARDRLISFVFDDKKIFKPKEKMHVKCILRRLSLENQARKLLFIEKGEIIKYEVKDGRGAKFIEGDLTVDSTSSFYFTFQIPDNVNLGDCNIEFHYEAPKKYIANQRFKHSFKIEEFEEPEFDTKCTVKKPAKGYVIDDNSIVTAEAKYYSGGGLSDCEAKWRITQSLESNFKPPNWSRFTFRNPYYQNMYPSYGDSSNNPQSSYNFNDTTNEKGESKLVIELRNPMRYVSSRAPGYSYNHHSHPPHFPTIYIRDRKMYALPMNMYEKSKQCFAAIKVSCKADIKDISQKVITTSSNYLVHPCEFYLGIKFQKQGIYFGDVLKIDVVLCDPNGKLIGGVDIAVEVFKNSGNDLKNSFFVKSDANEQKTIDVEFYEQWGATTYYIMLTAIDSRGLRSVVGNHCNVSVSPEPVKKNMDDAIARFQKRFQLDYPIGYKETRIAPDAISMKFDKLKYTLNDIGKLSIESAIAGHGIMLIFGMHILHKQLFFIREGGVKNEYDFTFNVTEDYIPNVSCCVYMFGKQYRKDINDFEITPHYADGNKIIQRPAHARGHASLSISHANYEMKVKVTPKDLELFPGAESEVVVEVEKKGKSFITLFIVDESVLALTGYNLELPMDVFYPRTNLMTQENFLRNYIYERKLKANLKRIEEEKVKFVAEMKKKEFDDEQSDVMRKRNEGYRKVKADELAKREKVLLDKLKEIWRKNEEMKPKVSAVFDDLDECESSYGGGGGVKFSMMKSRPRKPRRKMMKKGKKEKKKKKKKSKMRSKKMDMSMVFAEKCKDSAPMKKRECKEEEMDESESDDDDDIMEEEEKCEAPGGAPPEPDEEEDDTPIQMRKLFESTVIFTTSVLTDEQGTCVIPFKLPDNLTRYRIWAVAETGTNYYGMGESSFVSKLPFQVRPSIPQYLNFGDQVEMTFVLANQTDDVLELKVALRTTECLEIGDPSKRGFCVKIPANRRAEVKFPVSTLKVGEGRIQVAASAKGFSDAVEKPVNVYTPSIAQGFVVYGELDDDAMHVQQIVPPDEMSVYKGFGGLEMECTSTIFQSLTDAYLYVYNYAYDCCEQAASRILSIVSMYDIVEKFKLPVFGSLEKSRKVLKSSLKKLSKRQKGNGGFGMWTKESSLNAYVSVHVAHSVIRVRERFPEFFTDKTVASAKDYNILIEQCKKFCIGVTSYFPVTYKKLSTQSIRSFSLYVLGHFARLGLLNEKEKKKCLARCKKLRKEFTKKSNGTLETLSWLAFSFSQFSPEKVKDENCVELRREVYKAMVDEKKYTFFTDKIKYDYESSKLVMIGSGNIRTNGVILETFCHMTPNDDFIPKLAKYLLKMKKYGIWENTNTNSYVLLGLITYFNIFEKKEPNFTTKLWLKKEYMGEIAFKGRSMDFKTLKVPMKSICITMDEKELIEKKKAELYEVFEQNREERMKREEEQRKVEEEERKKMEEEKKKKKKGLFSQIKSILGKNQAEDDVDEFLEQQMEKRKALGAGDEKEEEMEDRIIKEIANKQLYIVKEGPGRLYYRITMKYAPRDLKLAAFDFGFIVNRSYHQVIPDDDKEEYNKKKPEEREKFLVKDPRSGMYKVKLGSLVRVRVSFKINKTKYQIAMVDQIPAGLDVLNPNLKTTIPIPRDEDYKYNQHWEQHVNYRTERVEAFHERVSAGTYYFTYVARARHCGVFSCLPTRLEEMYDEEVCGQCATDRLIVTDEKLE